MADPFIGEVKIFAGNFAPAGWAFCDGSLQSISQNTALFALVGTTYGGDGQQTFGLPDLRGRLALHQGQGAGLSIRVIGEMAGSESVTLTAAQMPAHTHTLRGSSSAATVTAPGGAVLAATSAASYGPGPATQAMAAGAIPVQGGSQPHNNMAPSLALNYIIALFGIFPSRN